MANIQGDLQRWFMDRPLWMQDAARRIIREGQLEKGDLEQLVALCKSQVGISDPSLQPARTTGPIQVSLISTPNQIIFRLQALFGIKGINALAPRKPLEFGNTPLTIVYGHNGSGKSGYIRLLKYASGQRKPGSLLPDVFSNRTEEQCCKIRYQVGENVTEVHWSPSTGPVDELRTLQVYDSECAFVYVAEENETTFEPIVLSLFTKLTEVCGTINSTLLAEINSNPSTKAALPIELQETQSGLWYGRLSNRTIAAEIAQRCI